MALWPWKIVRDGVRTAFAPFYDSSLHLSTLTQPNIVCSKQFISYKHFMPHTCYASDDVRVEWNIYECRLIIFEHADLSRPWHLVLFFWTAPCSCFQLSKQRDFLRIACHRVFNWGKAKGWKCFSSAACIVYLSHPLAAAADTNAIISCCLDEMFQILFSVGIFSVDTK